MRNALSLFFLIVFCVSFLGGAGRITAGEDGDEELSSDEYVRELEEKIADLEIKVIEIYGALEENMNSAKLYGDELVIHLQAGLSSLTFSVRRKQIRSGPAKQVLTIYESMARGGKKIAGELTESTDKMWRIQGEFSHHKMCFETAILQCYWLRTYIDYPNDANWSNLGAVQDDLRAQVSSHFSPQKPR